MNQIEQVIILFFSFIYGIITFLTLNLNKKIFINKSIFLKVISFAILSFNIALLYIIVIYNINQGIIHIYFIVLYILGFLTAVYKKCKIKGKIL